MEIFFAELSLLQLLHKLNLVIFTSTFFLGIYGELLISLLLWGTAADVAPLKGDTKACWIML